MKIAIVGAGITGSLLADFLDSENFNVSIFEKSRGCGGRASTKKTDFGQCDMGATIVPVKTIEFAQYMQQLCNQGIASQWPQDIYITHQNSGVKTPLEILESDRKYYVFNQKMNAACRHWVNNAQLHTNSLVSQVRYHHDKGWQLKINADWQSERFDKLVITAPWPQSQTIIEQSDVSLVLPTFSQTWTSCWSIALKLDQLVTSAVDLVYLKGHPIQTLVRDSSKPQRPEVMTAQQNEIWVAQLTNELSDDLGSQAMNEAISIATKELCELFGLSKQSVTDTYAHYWRYARPSAGQNPLGMLSNHQHGIYVGGDWSFGASIESAYEGARALVQLIKTGA
ncbi:MAG: NAD(P)-binding protein [Paraglaciecola sp.]|uniref:NAD(P)/FAD-dependent oxidoreductase n=1 Tax=Paraglaciecola sp. TaxID=1920173 RepID=UPI003296DA5C